MLETNDNYLPKGYQLKDYLIEKVLGEGGFGITYLATDINLKTKVVIKEFLPKEFSSRNSNNRSIVPFTTVGKNGTYEYLLEKFITEAQIIASIRYPNIVRVFNFFKANNTAYYVMDYIEGISLKKYLSKKKEFTLDEILSISIPILEGLKVVHSKNYIHRDIAPDNIIIKNNGMPMLIDFGTAKNVTRENSQSTVAIIKKGYSAPEQYVTRSEHTPATDVYAMGSVLYSMITGGKVAPESIERQMLILKKERDPIKDITQEYKNIYPKKLLKIIQKAMNLEQKDRFQTISDMLEEMAKLIPTSPPKPLPKSNKILFLSLSLLIMIPIIIFLLSRERKEEKEIKLESNISEKESKTEMIKEKTDKEKNKTKENKQNKTDIGGELQNTKSEKDIAEIILGL
jgi:serine/threonine protein kinase